MEKTTFNMTQKSLSEVMGVNDQEILKVLQDHLTPHDVELEDFILTLTNLISV
ncbi:hypothetical protein [Paenibacillus pabuli]|uniref:hypothetical protein n=1 Tax=Paenibacillus pabuli TaxID=1472 RepID=UPI001FFFC269|nr:hypothetical protein [Paenibacillus pabuli]UPK42458.1 hypothetical protein KET34_25205 [Paenibacillus pabuli]